LPVRKLTNEKDSSNRRAQLRSGGQMKVTMRWVPVITKIVAGTLGWILQIWAVVWVVSYFEMSPLPFVIGAGILATALSYCFFSLGWDAGYEFRQAEWSNHEPEERLFITAGLSDHDLGALRKLGLKKSWHDDL
jgi:hypothetical protein